MSHTGDVASCNVHWGADSIFCCSCGIVVKRGETNTQKHGMDETQSTSTIESNKRPLVERPVRYSIELEAGEFLLLLLEEELERVADFELFEDGAEAVLGLVSLSGF